MGAGVKVGGSQGKVGLPLSRPRKSMVASSVPDGIKNGIVYGIGISIGVDYGWRVGNNPSRAIITAFHACEREPPAVFG